MIVEPPRRKPLPRWAVVGFIGGLAYASGQHRIVESAITEMLALLGEQYAGTLPGSA